MRWPDRIPIIGTPVEFCASQIGVTQIAVDQMRMVEVGIDEDGVVQITARGTAGEIEGRADARTGNGSPGCVEKGKEIINKAYIL